MADIEPLLVSITTGLRVTGLSRSRFYELMNDGDAERGPTIESVKVGRRRLAKFKSLKRLAGEIGEAA